MALLLIVDMALLFWNINTLSLWHMPRLLNLFSVAFFISFLMAVLIIMCCTLCIMYSRSVRSLYTITRLARFVPTFVLPYSLADMWDASIGLRGYEQQWQYFSKHDLRADEPTPVPTFV